VEADVLAGLGGLSAPGGVGTEPRVGVATFDFGEFLVLGRVGDGYEVAGVAMGGRLGLVVRGGAVLVRQRAIDAASDRAEGGPGCFRPGPDAGVVDRVGAVGDVEDPGAGEEALDDVVD